MDPINILLVDDEARNLDALEAILSEDGYNLLRAEDADRALRVLLETEAVAAIVLDIRMPRMNGLELARTIKATRRFRQVPIVFLTAHMVEDQDVLEGYGAGAVEYLTKPFNPQILRHKVAVFAELFQKTRALAELNDKLEERVKERTAELERSEAALRDAAGQKDEFLAVLAHELRNPLAPLRVGLDLLVRTQHGQPAVVERTLATMNRQLDHMVRLLDDLLDVSRISRGVIELRQERTNLASVVRDAIESFRSVFEQKHIQLSADLATAAWSLVDPTRIAQIISNLLHNASKYTQEGGAVTVSLGASGERAVVQVVDTGIGLQQEQLERVFEMFARIEHQTQPAPRGAGIGLALAQRLARMHGGDLNATSAGEGHGTTFTLTLPIVAAEPARTTETPGAAGGTHKPLSILVIEDNDDVADVLCNWLEGLGHLTNLASTGPTGVELALATKPDLVLCDLGLPGMDGVEVCRNIRKHAHEFRPRIVALTGWGKAEDRKRTADAGFDDHLVKPVAPEALLAVLHDVASELHQSAMRCGS